MACRTTPPILDIERRAFHAWPAAEAQVVGGWRLRHNEGVTRRANSTWPNETDHTLPLERKLALVEAFYDHRGLPARYQICPAAQPKDLDAILERRGYVADAHTSVQVAGIAPVLAATTSRAGVADITATLSEEWFAAYREAECVDDHDAEIRRGILGRIAPRTAYAVLSMAGRPVATGLGVLEGGWLGLFSMATIADGRRRGAATAVLYALAAWGQQHEARAIYLQVMRDNLPARALYERAGFETLYDYHYRERLSVAR
jgi:ribosomal protein S18 acetylase RimI-like enzyme